MRNKLLEQIEKDVLADELGIYSLESRERMVDEDEITPAEEAFMKGYEEAG